MATTIYHKIFLYLLALIYILYLTILFGFNNNNLVQIVQFWLRIYVSLFLLIFFNPFQKTKFTEYDQRIVFSSALLLSTTVSINDLFIYINRTKELLKIF
jgi:hypothetical protein